MKKLLDFYGWFELNKNIIPENIEDAMFDDQVNGIGIVEEAIVLETEGSYFRRIRAKFINDCYFFSFSHVDWQLTAFRFFLEINPNQKTNVLLESNDSLSYMLEYGGNDFIRNKEKYFISLITLTDACFVDGIFYNTKIMTSNFETFFILSPKK